MVKYNSITAFSGIILQVNVNHTFMPPLLSLNSLLTITWPKLTSGSLNEDNKRIIQKETLLHMHLMFNSIF